MSKRSRWTLPLIAVLAGCDSQSNQTAPVPVAKATPLGVTATENSGSPRSSTEPTERLIGGVKFDVPAAWEEKTLSNSMILAEFTLVGQAGPGRLTLSTAGGGTTANMDRWKDQFRRGPDDPEPKESQITAAGRDAKLIEVFGAFADMTMGQGPASGPKPNWQLLGAAIPIDSEHNYFVKLTGPRETVAAHREQVLKFIQSARFE